jgi:hypothetical protein
MGSETPCEQRSSAMLAVGLQGGCPGKEALVIEMACCCKMRLAIVRWGRWHRDMSPGEHQAWQSLALVRSVTGGSLRREEMSHGVC